MTKMEKKFIIIIQDIYIKHIDRKHNSIRSPTPTLVVSFNPWPVSRPAIVSLQYRHHVQLNLNCTCRYRWLCSVLLRREHQC